MITSKAPMGGIRLGVFGKGGAGKSTVTVLLARELARKGYRPVVLDADSTNLGLHLALGAPEPPRSLVDHFGGMVFQGGLVTCPVDDPTPLSGADLNLDELTTLFQADTPSGVRLLVGGKMGDLGPGAGCDGPIAKIARDVRVQDNSDAYPPLLIDFKAGFEDSARGVLTALDWGVVIVDPTTASLHMALHMKEMVRKIRAGVPPATAHLQDAPHLAELARKQFKASRIQGLVAVLNRVPDSDTEAYLRRRLEALGGPRVLGMLPEDREVQTQWLHREEVRSPCMDSRIRALVLGLESLAAKGRMPEPVAL